MNPNEKDSPKSNQPAEGDPVWIRDIQARNFDLNLESADQIAQMCEGEKIHCEICGMGFPLWPPKEWASHWITEHNLEITLQQHAGSAALCSTNFNEAQRMFFQNQFLTRTTLRRRASALGLIRFPDSPSIVQ